MAFLVPANIPLGACGMIQTVPLAGWWQVGLEQSDRAVSPQAGSFQSLLNIGGCNDPFNVLDSLGGSDGKVLDSGLLIRLGPGLTVDEATHCSTNQYHETSCEPIAWSASSDDEFERAAANDLRPLLPGGDLSFREPLVLTDAGTMGIELHTQESVEPDAQDPTWHFSAGDQVLVVRIQWDSTATWEPPVWSTGPGGATISRQAAVRYTLLDAVPIGLYAYPAGPTFSGTRMTESLRVGTSLEVHRSQTIKLTRVAAPP